MTTRTRKERIRLATLRALAFVTFPADMTKLKEDAKILLIRPDHLGDILFTTPALRYLRETLPDAHIAYMVGPWSKEVVANNPNVDEVLTCEFPGFARRPKSSLIGPYLQLRREARRLRSRQFDLAINFRFDFWWGAMLAYFGGVPHRVGYATAETKPFLTLALPPLKGRHEVPQNLRLAETVARLIGPASPGSSQLEPSHSLEFYPREEEEQRAAAWIAAQMVEEPLVLIHPGTGAPVKLWTPEGFARVADDLVERHGASVILSGARVEEPLVQEVQRHMHHRAHPLIDASLGQLASVLKRCRMAVGLDSGVMHLASAVGTPTVRLYGPVDDITFGPWGERERHVVVKSDLSCIPCNRLDFAPAQLPEHLCIKSISVERVLEAVERVMAGSR